MRQAATVGSHRTAFLPEFYSWKALSSLLWSDGMLVPLISPKPAVCCDTSYVLVHAYFTHNGKCDHRNAEITVLGLWVVSIKFENGAMSQRRALPGSEAAR